MEVNNKSEINKLFGTEDAPDTPAEPELQKSPISTSNDAPTGTPANESPFQGESKPAPKSVIPDSVSDVTNPLGTNSFSSEASFTIGDHEGFSSLLNDGRKVGLRLMLIAIPVTLLIGLAAGAFACFVYFFGLHISADDNAARTAMNSVTEFIKENHEKDAEVIFTEVYVNNKTNQFDCVVFAVIKNSPIDYNNTALRVLIDKSSDEILVFGEFDPDEFDRLRESSDPNDRIQAEILADRHHNFKRILEEIHDSSTNWTSVNPFYLNARNR
jgi:hypothetical protein